MAKRKQSCEESKSKQSKRQRNTAQPPKSQQTVFVCGSNDDGQLGCSLGETSTPICLHELVNIVLLKAGALHTGALDLAGNLGLGVAMTKALLVGRQIREPRSKSSFPLNLQKS